MHAFFRQNCLVFLLCFFLLAPSQLAAQNTLHEDFKETIAAEVVSVAETRTRTVPGTDTIVSIQEITVRLKDGTKAGELATFANEFAELKPGDAVFVNRTETIAGDEYFILMDVDRRLPLLYLAIGFVIFTILLTGWQGVRAITSLGLSIAAIIFLLVPALLAGWNPALASLLIAGLILGVVIFFTHGFNPRSYIAFSGTWAAVSVTCLLSYLTVNWLHLSGFSSEGAITLNFATSGSLDLSGLLLGGIIIGLLGVLDDVSITQASVVQELKAANAKLAAVELYQRAIRVGKDHIGSLINTLALAYVGVALPLILLFSRAESDIFITLNQEIVATEITRILLGSIGLVLAVPITTAIAAWYFGKQTHVAEEAVHHCGHTHH